MCVGSAQWAHADILLTPSIGFKFAGNTNIVGGEPGAGSKRVSLGIAAAILGDGPIGIEADFAYNPRFFEGEGDQGLVSRNRVTTLTGNVLVTMPLSISRYTPRPYATGGMGLMHVGLDLLGDVFQVDDTMLAMNAGGGVLGPLRHDLSVRVDVRYFRNISKGGESVVVVGPDTTRLGFWRFAAGLTLHFDR